MQIDARKSSVYCLLFRHPIVQAASLTAGQGVLPPGWKSPLLCPARHIRGARMSDALKSPPMKPLWTRAIAHRITSLWPVKAVGTTVFMTLFFWAYFTVLENPSRPPFVVPTMAIDHWISLVPWAYGFYVSLWVYVSLPPALLLNMRALLHFGGWVLTMCLLCLVFFWWFPTQTPTLDIDWQRYPGLALIKGLDAPGNAFPSLHVASAVFSAFWLRRIFAAIGTPRWLQTLNVLQCLAIAWSTIATLQHVAWDVMAGAAVGAAFGWASLRHADHRQRPITL